MPVTFSATDILVQRGRWTLVIERPVYVRDGYGQKKIAWWEDIGTRRALITPLSGREYFEANKTESEVTHKVSLRYLRWLRPHMRFRREAFTAAIEYTIVGVNTGGAGTASFVTAGNWLIDLQTGATAEVQDSTGNDGTYTLRAGSSYDSVTDQTTINVEEAVGDPTADGVIQFGGEHDEVIYNIVAIPGQSFSTDRQMTVLVKEQADYPEP